MISKKRPDLLPRIVTRGGKCLKSNQVADSDRSQSTTRYVRNFDGNVKVGDRIGGFIFIFDNLVRTPTMARTTSMARTTRLARMAVFFFFTNENRVPEPPSYFANFFANQAIGFNKMISRADICEYRASDGTLAQDSEKCQPHHVYQDRCETG